MISPETDPVATGEKFRVSSWLWNGATVTGVMVSAVNASVFEVMALMDRSCEPALLTITFFL